MTPVRPAAFYTPLKHPDQVEISGDREIARGLMRAMAAAGFAPELASRFLTWQRHHDPAAIERLGRLGALTAATLVRRYRRRPAARRPRLWLTYQNYYRCPDLLGPVVAPALGIPYVLVEASVSTRSRRTPFRPWVSAARLAIRQADLLFVQSPRDLPRLRTLRGARFAAERLHLLPPEVDVRRYDVSPDGRTRARAALAAACPGLDGPILLAVGMMRTADKLDSYRLLAAALARLDARAPARPWRLVAVGDGPARDAVRAALAPLPAGRVHFIGARPPAELPACYLGADLLAWPGLGEALGLVYLEAAAAGVPVVACHGPGPDVMVAPGGGCLTAPDPEAFAAGLARLLDDPPAARGMGETARRFAVAERSTEAFEQRLRQGLARLDLA